MSQQFGMAALLDDLAAGDNRVEVQVSANPHARQPDQATTVEITLRSRGPVVRAEASADETTPPAVPVRASTTDLTPP